MNKAIFFFPLLLLLATSAYSGNRLNAQWQVLFDGATLQDWEQRDGKAKYYVKDNMIIGESAVDTLDSFLCTSASYANFILDLEFWADDEMNSGIQIRSNSVPEYDGNRVHGYQVEIDPSERAWSAGIYEQGHRGWLYDLRQNEAARKAFKHNTWNKLHIEAIGTTIRTWLNDVPAAYLVDQLTAEGFIALQVHAMDKVGVKVRWRNIRIIDLGTSDQYPMIIRTNSK